MRYNIRVTQSIVIIFFRGFVKVGVMEFEQPGSSGMRLMCRNDLYTIMKNSNAPSFEKKILFMERELLNSYGSNETSRHEAKQKLKQLKHQFKKRWLAARKMVVRFEENNRDWLEGVVSLPSAGMSPGRPQKSFNESSERSKRRKTRDLRSTEVAELTFATQMKLREAGKPEASKVLKNITNSPSKAKKYTTAMKRMSEENRNQLSPLRALSMFTEAGLTRTQYEIIRSTNKKFFPCYSLLQKIKKECYPSPDSFRVTSTCVEVELQHLLDHTASRLVEDLKEVVNSLNDEEKKSMTLISKWGCDGSQQAQYKMKFEHEGDSDANIFQSSLVPLQLYTGKEKKVVWQNNTSSSPRYCRPIRLRFIKESIDVTREEIDYINSKITALVPTEFEGTCIKHKMLFTMVDGKVCNAATHTRYSMRCYICNLTSKDFNDLSKKGETVKQNLSFGLSLLHARIRFFESMLHVAYKLPVKKWNVKLTKDEERLVKEKKEEIQKKFKESLGLLVDIPKAGFGNTNDGNTSRRFFENHEISAEITGIDKSLLYRLKVILDTLCSGHAINIEKFEEYAQETAELYVKLYSFYPMSPTLHKVLRHGAEVIKEAILPIGLLSEEAAEARNKHIRAYRLTYARKFSREACNRDVINRLLLTSDPVITGMRKPPKKKARALMNEVVNLLLPADEFNLSIGDDESCEDEF